MDKINTTKKCTKCGYRKPMSQYYNHHTNKDGKDGSCMDCTRQRVKDRYHADPTHRDQHNKRCTNRQRIRRQTDPAFRLRRTLRARMTCALDGKLKHDTTMALIGCSRDFLMGYLEAQFREGMQWGVRGSFEVDHILPVSAFDLSSEFQQRKAFHYTNLQPLYQHENRQKSDKYDPDDLKKYLAKPL